MKTNALKTALIRGLPAAFLAWFSYGAFTSFFDDTILEQMFDSSGILFGVLMAVLAVCFFYRSALKNGKQEE